MAIELKGQLTEESLEEVFAVLQQGEHACSLLVSDGISEKIFYFSIGGIRMVSLGGRRATPILELFIQAGKLQPEERDRVLEQAKRTERRAGEALQELGYATKEEVEDIVRSQLESELCDLFMWPDAEFEFRDGQPPPQFYEGGHRAASITCDVPEFLDGVRTRRERLRSIRMKIPSNRELFRTTVDGRESWDPRAEDVASRVFGLIDGRRRVRDIQEKSGLTSLQVCEALYELLDEGHVERTESASAGREADREELLKEIGQLEKARNEMMGDLIVRTRLAKAYEQIRDNLKAAQVWKEIARIHRRNNDLKQTFNALRFAIRCVPQDFNTREQILEIYRAQGMVGKLLEEGRVLAEMLFKNNLLNRARNLLGNLVHLAPQDSKLRKLYAMTLLGLGERTAALQELQQLASILERDGSSRSELKEVYRRILALDRRNKTFRRKLYTLTANRKVIWVTRGAMVAAALLILFGTGSFLYELVATADFKEQGLELEQLLRENRYAAARERARSLQRKFPLSRVQRNVTDLIAEIDDLERTYLRHYVPDEMKRAEKWKREGHYDKAIEILQRVEAAIPDRKMVEEARSEIDQMISAEESALELLREGSAALEERRIDTAHRIFNNVQSLYPRTKAARELRFPLRIESIPKGARVYVNGVDRGFTPVLLEYSPQAKTRIRLEMNYFEPHEIDVTEVLEPTELIFLRRQTYWIFETDGPIETTPVLAGNALYFVGRDRNLYAVAARDGAELFRTSLGIFGDSVATAAVVDGFVVVATSRGEVIGLDATEGSPLWRKQIGKHIRADVIPDHRNGLVFLTEETGRVCALKASTGDIVWTQRAGASPTSPPILGEEHVFVSLGERRCLAALRRGDGKEAWTQHVGGGALTTPPGVDGAIVGFGSDDRSVYAVDVNNRLQGTRRYVPYSFRTTGVLKAAPRIDGQTVYAACSDGFVYCHRLGKKMDQPKWGPIAIGGGAEIVATPVLGEDRVYISSTNGHLFALDRMSGTIRWAFRTGDALRAPPLVHEGTIYLTSTDGNLYAIRE